MVIFINLLQKESEVSNQTMRTFIQLLAPFAPHMAEELWERLGGHPSVTNSAWPKFDAAKLEDDRFKIMLQVNGKLRGEMLVSKSITAEEAIALAKQDEKVAQHINGTTLVKEVYVPGRIVNFVVK